MRTLDEVIEIASDWTNGFDEMSIEKQMLHYLKEYREIKKHLACLDDVEIRGDNTQVVNNLPLTWDELKAMEGKPVWIETDNLKFWTVVDNFRAICNQECLCCSKGYMCRSTHARGDWKAYRKEWSH